MAEIGVELLQIGVLVRNHLAQETVEISERLHLASPKLGFILVLVPQLLEAHHGGVQSGIQGLVVLRTLAPPGSEVHRAEAVDLFV